MKNYYMFTLAFVFINAHLIAQTKWIAHKSHSGNSSSFKTAITNHLFDIDASNFGVGIERHVRTAQLDSVILLPDNRAVMVTSEYCSYPDYNDKTSLWRAGRDTVDHHPLFSSEHSSEEIRRALKNDYYFRNSMDDVKLIGFGKNQIVPQSGNTSTLHQSELSTNKIPSNLFDRPVHVKKEIRVRSGEVEFYLWDNDVVDGDTISLNVNGEWVLERFKVTKSKKLVRVTLKPGGENYLILYAHNEGSIPTNTTSLSIHDGYKTSNVLIKSSMKSSDAIRLNYVPEAEQEQFIPTGRNPDEGRNPFDGFAVLMIALFLSTLAIMFIRPAPSEV